MAMADKKHPADPVIHKSGDQKGALHVWHKDIGGREHSQCRRVVRGVTS